MTPRRFPPPWTVEERPALLHRQGRQQPGYRLRLLRGGARPARRCEADDERSGAVGRGDVTIVAKLGAVTLPLVDPVGARYHAKMGRDPMRNAIAMVLLIGACFVPASADDGMVRTGRVYGCNYEGRLYTDGQFCSLPCRTSNCDMQVCHGGHWVIERAACLAGFGCSHYC